MDTRTLAEMHAQESQYWWHIGRREVLNQVLKRFLVPTHGLTVLDVGCGTGINFGWLHAWGSIHGLDSSAEALNFCKLHSAYDSLIEADAAQFNPPQQFDLLTAFDVLEHIQKDKEAIQTWSRSLKSGGVIFISVPAHQWLYGPHDRALQHFRRYNATILRQRIEAADFRVELLSPFFFFTFPIFILVRLFQKGNLTGRTSYETVSSVSGMSKFLVFLSRIEAFLLGRGWGLPWGSSLLVIAKKK